MSSYVEQVKEVIEEIRCNHIFVACEIKNAYLSDVPETAYYKVLERMVKDEDLVHLSKGMYYRPEKRENEIVPIKDEQIIEYYVAEKTGIIVGDKLFEKAGIAKKTSKETLILSNNLREEQKSIRNIKVQKICLHLDGDTIPVVETMEILQNYNRVEGIDKKRFLSYMRKFSEGYSDKSTCYVIENKKYKKSTIAFLERMLTWYGVENSLKQYLSPLSEYKIPTIDELRENIPIEIEKRLKEYVEQLKCIYQTHLEDVILYGSYARGDYDENSDIDIMILLEISDLEIKEYRHQLSELTYEFNENHNLDIKPIAKNKQEFIKWVETYPFYANIKREGVTLYGVA